MSSRRFRTILDAARRGVPALVLAAMLLPWSFGPAAPARADHAPDHDPATRIQIVVKTIHMFDDRDPGKGEMHFSMRFVCIHAATPCFMPDSGMGMGGEGKDLMVDKIEKSFSAGTGETVTLNTVLPGATVLRPFYDASEETGYAVYPGQRYFISSDIEERDDFTDSEYLGFTDLTLEQEGGWGIGTHKLRSYHLRDGQRVPGDYEVEVEIRVARLPELRPTRIEILEAPGSTDNVVCMTVLNAGAGDAGPFDVTLRSDRDVLRNGTTSAGRLGSGQLGALCVTTDLPKSGQHVLSVTVDEARAVPEENDLNNRLEEPYVAPEAPSGPGVGPNPPPPPSTSQADLIVSALRVNGKEPSANDACKAGKNDVTIVVKNQGMAAATSFAVRLVVDDDDEGHEKPVGSLEAGKEQEVRFDDVRLKKGERTLTAIADAKKTVAESKEDNNERKVTVKCKDDDD